MRIGSSARSALSSRTAWMRRIAGSPRLTTARRRNVRWVTEGTGGTLGRWRCIPDGMEFLQPPTWREALEARAAHPDALPIWGGTDVMVELNFARKRPEALLDLTRVDELSRWSAEDGWFRIGAGVSYTRVIDGARAPSCPGWRWRRGRSARRRSATGGRSGGTSDRPHPPVTRCRRCSRAARRSSWPPRAVRGGCAIDDFVTGPKRNALGGGRADRGGLDAARARSAAVREGRHAQRDGDRGVLVRARSGDGTHLHRLGGAAAAARA